MLGMFRRGAKWQEVQWTSGDRDIFLKIQFAEGPGPKGQTPTVEKLGPADGRPLGNIDEAEMVREVLAAVTAYNKKNLCALRVSGIRYRPSPDTNPADHGAAARKLLNLM